MQNLKDLPHTVSAKKPMLKLSNQKTRQLSSLNMCKIEKKGIVFFFKAVYSLPIELLNYPTKFLLNQIRT